jgi:hypothetical protein
MLDYAANGSAYWTGERLRQCAIDTAKPSDPPLDDRVAALLGQESEPDVKGFWGRVDENLRLGRVRLIFVLDEAPRELRRLTEFLNEQMRDTEVLLLEVKQFKGADNLHALVPRLIGRTEKAAIKKQGVFTRKSLDEVFDQIGRRSSGELTIARDLELWLRGAGAEIFTTANGFAPKFHVAGEEYYPFKITEAGSVSMWFHYLKRKSAFVDEQARQELLARLNQIPGVSIAPEKIGGKPSFPLSILLEPGALEAFKQTIQWVVQVARAKSGLQFHN